MRADVPTGWLASSTGLPRRSPRAGGPEYLVALEVAGRRSGRIVSLPLVVAAVDDERYLVSMLGEEVNWVRNVRAVGGEVALRHGRREEVHLQVTSKK
jgi:F420H(2)-dependent quinone reductase